MEHFGRNMIRATPYSAVCPRMCVSDSRLSKFKMQRNFIEQNGLKISRPYENPVCSTLKILTFNSTSCDTTPPSAIPAAAILCFSARFQALTGYLHPAQSDRIG